MTKRIRVIQHYERREGFQAMVCAWKGGRMRFPHSPIDSPIFPALEWAEQWCVDVIAASHASMGPLAIALSERYSGTVIEVV